MGAFLNALKMLFGRSQEQIDIQEKFRKTLVDVDQRNEQLDEILKDLEGISRRMDSRRSDPPAPTAIIRKEAIG